jgi:DNA-binding LacI/PurR family transcriptional regulator
MAHADPPPPGEPGRARTIVELARLAGVSPGTVSRALAGKAVVAAPTMARIKSLAAEHDFRLNQMASRLRTRRTGVIGVVAPLGHERRQHLSDPFFMTMIGHLADALTENGYDLMLSRVIPDAADWLERIVDSGMLDGVLLLGQSDQLEAIERVAARYRPLVAWGGHHPDQAHCSVGTDNLLGGRMAGEHLLAAGARRIAFLGDLRTPEIRQRFEGLVAVMAERGRPAPLLLETHLAADVMGGEIAAHLRRHGDGIDGVFAASDVIAMMTLRALADRDVPVPGGVQVVGYDDLPIAVQTVPRISTIRQDFAGGAKAMVERLFARMAGDAPGSLQFPPELVVRDSTRA